ncbi:MAG: sugar ABC transporter permease [Corynebacterium sp.]|nr:sugar ABC transporter permease [Corynebacterium sp.]
MLETMKTAYTSGDIYTKLSLLVFGLGNLKRRQYAKGLLFLAIEIAALTWIISIGARKIAELPTLGGDGGQTRVKVNGFWVYTQSTPSVVVLLYGVVAICAIIALGWFATVALRSSYKAEEQTHRIGTARTFRDDLRELTNSDAHITFMTLPTLGIVLFTILPLIFMISMAFTSYDSRNALYFNWVGLDNFITVLTDSGGIVNLNLFISVLTWTLIWAFFATFLNYFLGMFLAMLINRRTTWGKNMWRAIFSLSVVVPQFASLLILRSMLQPQGAINRLLVSWGIIDNPLPFFTNSTWARVTVIVVNLWIGIPYTIMQVTGILQNVPGELYEAARIDGASWWQTYRFITMPYLLFVMTPYLITTFTANVNNFNVIYMLSGGDPTPIGASAGKTDLLITWLYKLTVDRGDYNVGAVIGILTFIVLSIVALITYRRSGSYRNEEGFQ